MRKKNKEMKYFFVNILIASIIVYLLQELWWNAYMNSVIKFTFSGQTVLYYLQGGVMFYAILRAVFDEYIWQSETPIKGVEFNNK